MTGAPAVVVIPTAFSSGQIGASLINTAKVKKVVRLNLKDYKVGDRFYTYTLTGTEGQDFSRKVFVNGTGPALVAGGPADYESIKAGSSLITEEIRIVLPPLSAVYVLVEPGTKTLAINNEVTSAGVTPEESQISIYPNPSDGSFTIRNIPGFVSRIEIQDLNGATVFSKENGADTFETQLTTRLAPGTYLISFRGEGRSVIKKIIIK
jgi:aspartate 1-decarboxylase